MSSQALPTYSHAIEAGKDAPQSACITLNMSDRLRLIHFPEHICHMVRKVILDSARNCIRSERNYAGAHEFRLADISWSNSSSKLVTTHLIALIFSALHHQGWDLVISTRVSQKTDDKDTFCFRHGCPAIARASAFFSIVFKKSDEIHLVQAPPEVIAIFRKNTCQITQEQGYSNKSGAYRFKPKGYPWMSSGKETVHSRLWLLSILDTLNHLGFEIYASIAITGPESWIVKGPIKAASPGTP
ncbi:hypothetical protein BOTBODRAFT_36367 [Botryobasidium botryosum FD-172 SS1]|uniref:Uncharacterized protein n=1 Tax=Botryobasidium botryosum (strain FD-172 SS1) TaxID=930990 RepID=A0A067M3B6_BOTB1|nr:hypothetical protein BOTBODRAFT_36367 [Botryobasidium botryosum FD-172 SS1]